MFDIGWSELIVVGVVALVVIGPKELPGVIRSVGRAVSKLRTMAGEFRTQFDDAMREAELHEVKKTFTDMGEAATSAASAVANPVGAVLNEVKASAEGASGVTEASQALQSIEADARALEAEIAKPEIAQPESPAAPAPATPAPEAAKS
ncbi:Sec-independent protein translocase protein TatB [Rhabdaerophilum sp. SD176]|uniref:Sec-independent protein translocase protein TatB n=1 Tax=Rhabdaerophilum sp. SD176 TaxID=2983548 RepID=UPI0024DF5B53|nr:Sec-independent protein translocase protein TatB [Rhabdaerophilum sp. SD176]